jgi:hypothetical protein
MAWQGAWANFVPCTSRNCAITVPNSRIRYGSLSGVTSCLYLPQYFSSQFTVSLPVSQFEAFIARLQPHASHRSALKAVR